jgi:hypothetical protein
MIEDKYRVIMGGYIIAKDMSLEHATIFLKGIFEEYYAEPGLEVTIQRQPDETVEAAE